MLVCKFRISAQSVVVLARLEVLEGIKRKRGMLKKKTLAIICKK
jgi:hypothetical protein